MLKNKKNVTWLYSFLKGRSICSSFIVSSATYKMLCPLTLFPLLSIRKCDGNALSEYSPCPAVLPSYPEGCVVILETQRKWQNQILEVTLWDLATGHLLFECRIFFPGIYFCIWIGYNSDTVNHVILYFLTWVFGLTGIILILTYHVTHISKTYTVCYLMDSSGQLCCSEAVKRFSLIAP